MRTRDTAGRDEAPLDVDVLYVSYDGALEPLGASQILPYLTGLSAGGARFTLLTFEKAADLRNAERVTALESRLRSQGIRWIRRTWHGRPSLPATAWDLAAGRRTVASWARRHPGGVVHARGYLPAAMGLAAKRSGGRLLFDMRGFWVDERIEGGYWAPDGPQVRIGRRIERAALGGADHLVSLTRRGAERVGDLLPSAARLPVVVIPTCVDLERFRPPGDAGAARRALGLGDGPVLMHVGTLTGWYDGARTLAVARAFRERTGGTFVILTRDVDAATALARDAGVDARIASAHPEEVPAWLAGADAGLALVRQSPSKDASFPTKVGEYLATGLAVLASPIGDMREFETPGVVSILDEGSPEAAAEWLAGAAAAPHRVAGARELAEARLSVAAGVRDLVPVYRGLASGARSPRNDSR